METGTCRCFSIDVRVCVCVGVWIVGCKRNNNSNNQTRIVAWMTKLNYKFHCSFPPMGERMLSQNPSNFRIAHRSTIVHMWRVSFGFIWLKCSRRNHVTSHVKCSKNGACHNNWFGFWSYIIYLEYIIVFDVVRICLFLSATLSWLRSAVDQYSFFSVMSYCLST